MILFFLLLLAYLAGSIPFGLWIASAKGINLREIGSGNIGATNVFRALGPSWGLTVFVLDALKATLPTLLAIHYLPYPFEHVLVGITAVLGHSFTIFSKFKGGKGVAPAMGMLLALSPMIFAIALAYGVLIIVVTRMVSLASVSGAVMVAGLFIAMGYPWPYSALVSALAAVIIIRHRSNVIRIWNGSENKLEFWKKDS